MPETKEVKIFLESLPKGIYSAEKAYERFLLSVILDILFLLDRDRDKMLETFKKLICDYSGSLEGALDFLEKFVDLRPLRERIITLKLIKAQLMLVRESKRNA